jgi:hypothetical protein
MRCWRRLTANWAHRSINPKPSRTAVRRLRRCALNAPGSGLRRQRARRSCRATKLLGLRYPSALRPRQPGMANHEARSMRWTEAATGAVHGVAGTSLSCLSAVAEGLFNQSPNNEQNHRVSAHDEFRTQWEMPLACRFDRSTINCSCYVVSTTYL